MSRVEWLHDIGGQVDDVLKNYGSDLTDHSRSVLLQIKDWVKNRIKEEVMRETNKGLLYRH